MERNDDKNTQIMQLVKQSEGVKAPEKTPSKSKVTNPIAKTFIKYFASSKGKFSIKDIFR